MSRCRHLGIIFFCFVERGAAVSEGDVGLRGRAQLAVLGFCGVSGRIRIPDPVFEMISESDPVFKIMSDSDPVVNWDLV